jgi:hypothetical protein
MPAIYRIRCSNRCQLPDPAAGVEGNVAAVGRRDGIELSEGGYALKLDDGTLAYLCHPGESGELRARGLTWRRARAQRRLFMVEYRICTACGALHEETLVEIPRNGCIISFLVLAVTLPGLRFIAGWSWAISLVAAFLLAVFVMIVTDRLYRARWRKENEGQTIRRCPSCGYDRLMTLFDAEDEALPCPCCKMRSLRCECIGRS